MFPRGPSLRSVHQLLSSLSRSGIQMLRSNQSIVDLADSDTLELSRCAGHRHVRRIPDTEPSGIGASLPARGPHSFGETGSCIGLPQSVGRPPRQHASVSWARRSHVFIWFTESHIVCITVLYFQFNHKLTLTFVSSFVKYEHFVEKVLCLWSLSISENQSQFGFLSKSTYYF